jgi:RNA polymerase sigma factor (sigma-70 family)
MSDAEALFTAHRGGVHRYLTRVVGHPDLARDLTQEVFLRVSRTDVPLAGCDELRGWVFRIARNLALNYLRDRGRRGEAVALTDTDARPAAQEVALAMREALERLPELERDVFLLREAVGLSYDEIATACVVSVDAVRARLHRARVQLRETLSGPLERHQETGVRLSFRGRS